MNTGCQTFQTIIKTDTTYFLKIKKNKTSKQLLAKEKRREGSVSSVSSVSRVSRLAFWDRNDL